MANPYTAKNTMVSSEAVDTFLTAILPNNTAIPAKPTRFTSTFVSRGAFGVVFHIDVDINIENPFETFYVTDEQGLIITSSNTHIPDTSLHIHRFCCKIVFINTEEDEFSFTNECVKQKDIYARTNQNLNSVCLPLFFYSIVSKEPNTNLLYLFIREIFASHPDKYTPSIKLGISFMPYSVNSLTEIAPHNALSILQTDMIIAELNSASARAIASGNPPDEAAVIHIFQNNTPIYSFVVVVSLLVRLYIAGYCHGDLHLENIIVCDFPSGLILDRDMAGDTYLKPSIHLIDTGFAFRHMQAIPENIVSNYDSFQSVIATIIRQVVPKSGLTMLTHEPHTWFPQIFWNENIYKFIFVLFQHFERYRDNLETRILTNTSILDPAIIPNIRAENANLIASVDAYIGSIPTSSPENSLQIYNSFGGRRRRRRNYYYVSKRKQTKRKHHTRSMRRRKSQRRK